MKTLLLKLTLTLLLIPLFTNAQTPSVDILTFDENEAFNVVDDIGLMYINFTIPSCTSYDLSELGVNINADSDAGNIKLALYTSTNALLYQTPEISVTGGISEYVSYSIPTGSLTLAEATSYRVAVIGSTTSPDRISIDAAASPINNGVATNVSDGATYKVYTGITYPTFPEPLFYDGATYRTISVVIKGDDISPPAPTVSTTAISAITQTTATSGGNITADVSATITASGVCWNTTGTPTITDSKTSDGTETGVFSSDLTGLSPLTTYYVRAYTTESCAGTVYGSEVSFTTPDYEPTVSTKSVSFITPTTATGGGNVTNESSEAVTVRGICWNTIGTPLISDNFTSDGTGTGIFESDLTGLIDGTTYYVRAYATNSVGTYYGNEVSFVAETQPADIVSFTEFTGYHSLPNDILHSIEFRMPTGECGTAADYDLRKLGVNINVTSGPGQVKMAIYDNLNNLLYETAEFSVTGGFAEYVSIPVLPGSVTLEMGNSYWVSIIGNPDTEEVPIAIEASESFSNLGVATNVSTSSLSISSGNTYPIFPEPRTHNISWYRAVSLVVQGDALEVLEEIPPVIYCPDDIEQIAESVCEVIVDITEPTATDNCSETFTFTGIRSDELALDAAYPVGITTITWTATDESDNVSSSCDQTITITDGVAPTVLTQNITVQLDATLYVEITPEQIDNESFDACGEIVTMSLNTTGFSCEDLGENTVTLTITDSNGNINSAIATVTVKDENVLPTAITQDITVHLDENGNVIITPAQINDGSTYNCAGASYSLDIDEFTCENIGENIVTLTVTDTNENSDSAEATVTVVDNMPAEVITQNITAQLDANGEVTVTPAMVDNGSTDNCEIDYLKIAKYASSTIYFTGEQSNQIWSANSDGSGSPVTLYDISEGIEGFDPKGIEVNLNSGILYFSGKNGEEGSNIFAAPADGTGTIEIVPNTNSGYTLHDFEFDWENNKVFYSTDDGLFVANADGTGSVTTMFDNEYVIALTYNRTNDKIYYVVREDSIGVINADGTNRNDNLFDADIPKGITVDEVAGRLFWIERDFGKVYTALADGSEEPYELYNDGTEFMESEGVYAPYGIDYDATTGMLYWTVFNKYDSMDYIFTAPADGSGEPQLLYSGNFGRIKGIAAGRNITGGGGTGDFEESIAFTCEDVGENTVTLQVTDIYGNSSTATATVTLENNILPTVVTQDITVQLDEGGFATITAEDIDNGSFGNCGIESMSLDFTEFNCSAIGENTVTLTVTDIYENSASATAIVTVEDLVAPTVVTQNITVQLGEDGLATITAEEIDNGSTDTCGINTMSLDITEFSCSTIGENTVTLTVTDASGNSASATAIVTVEDLVAPTVVTQNITVQLDENGDVTVTPELVDNGSTDNCEIDYLEIAKNVELTIPTIYFTGNRDGMVWSANSDGSGSPTLLYNTSQGPVGIEVNLNSGILYFTGGANDSYIFSTSADGTGTIETLPNTYTESHHYLDLEFDWENNRVFFTTWDEGIFVGNADGTGSATKVGDVTGAFAITYNRTNDKIYYVSTNGVNIGVMNADGTNRNDTLFLVDEVQGITVDEVTGRLFWIEKDLGKVYTALADGSEVPYELCDIGNSLFEYGDSPDSGFGIDYNAATGMLYWTVNNKSNNMDYVLTAPADGSAEPQLLYSGNFGGIKGIAAGRNITGGEGEGVIGESVAYTCSDIGVNTVILEVTDVNGNRASKTATVTVEDKSAPTVVTQNITVELDEDGLATITAAQIDSESFDNCGIDTMSLNNTEFSCEDIGEENTVTLTVTDENGNSDSATAVVTVEDNRYPTIATLTGVSVNSDIGVCTYASSQLTAPSANDNCSVASVVATPASLVLGANTVTWTVTDGAGLTATSIQTVTVVDTQDPIITAQDISVTLTASGTVSIIAEDILISGTDNCGSITYTLSQSIFGETDAINSPITIQLTGTDPSENATSVPVMVTIIDPVPVIITQDILVYLDENGNASITPEQVDNGSSSVVGLSGLSLDITMFNCSNIGENTVMLTATSILGATASATAVVTIEDNSAPTVNTQNITVQLNENGVANITTTQIDNGSTDNCGIESYTLDSTAFDCSNVGENTVTLTVTDVNGNSDSATATVTVEDNSVPTVVTQNITVELDANGLATITAAQIDSESFDNCGIESYTLDSTAFDCSNVGENTVTLTVTDVNGNSDSATATVTVEDSIAPTVITQNITVQLNENGVASITTDQIDNGSTDNCEIESYTLDSTAFDCANVGENTVALTVTDVNGNSNTAIAVVAVEDSIAPTAIAVAPFTLQLDEFGSDISITAAAIDNGSTDICGIASIAIDKDTFDCSNLGDNIVTLTVTDVNGNTARATTTITIEDVTAPIVITQNMTVDLNDTFDATISTDDIDDESLDNCGIATMSLDRIDFECANLGEYTVTLTVTDTSGNTASEIAIVTVIGDDLDGDLITDNCDPDMDGDGVDNEFDNCVRTFNSDQDDLDFNGIGDVCDTTDVSFPQGFSPNGDGIRDTFIVKGLAQHGENTFEVYNRWGNKVYSSQFYQNNWDGISNGQSVFSKNEKLPAGPYFYVLTAGYNTVYKGWMYINY